MSRITVKGLSSALNSLGIDLLGYDKRYADSEGKSIPFINLDELMKFEIKNYTLDMENKRLWISLNVRDTVGFDNFDNEIILENNRIDEISSISKLHSVVVFYISKLNTLEKEVAYFETLMDASGYLQKMEEKYSIRDEKYVIYMDYNLESQNNINRICWISAKEE